MCERCDHKSTPQPAQATFLPLASTPTEEPSCDDDWGSGTPGRRKKIWELQSGWGCSIVGTCVSLADLRALARKLQLRTKPDFPADYQLHGHFASSLGDANRTAKLLNKLLDRKHAGAIRRFGKLRNSDELGRQWAEALAAGDIPGPYWAILTHPHTDEALAERMFADVHMLSHLVGASNRADIRVLRELEAENIELRDGLSRDRRRAAERSVQQQGEIDRLAEAARTATRARLKAEAAVSARPGGIDVETLRKVREEAQHHQARADTLAADLADHRRHAGQLEATVQALRDELDALERALPKGDDPAAVADADACAFNLDGRCILYVGGRSNYVCRLRALVERWNGELLYHDGGLEKSLDELAGSVVRADAVVFPTDCVSHSAANKVKRLCRQTMKPFVPLRSSGVGSFVAGVQAAFATANR
jgi:hypothetical protein